MVRLFATVHQLVALQVAGCGEQLAAYFAAVPGLARVAFAVQVEQADLAVALSTGRAAVRLQRARGPQELNLRHKHDRAQ